MPTFPKGFWTAKVATRNESVVNHHRRHQIQTIQGKVTWIMDPTDLRGIPAIGRGVPGRIAGTNPEDITNRDS
jgi:hypothetical protein